MSEPQPKEPVNLPGGEPQAERQRQVEALAEDYLERLLAGESPDRLALLAGHPDLADLLGPRLELVELMHRVARAQRPADGETASLALPGMPAERALRLKCPHCGNGIQLVDLAGGEVTCGSCGSSFHVDARATTTYNRAALPRSIGKFEVLEQLGRGAFGTVYKARDPQLQRLVAVKVPRSRSFATAEEEERFLREARAAAQLSHPGIVPVLEIVHDRGVPFIVSEYVEGLTLADVLTARRPNFRESAELIAAVADALDYAHRQKIVHRDIKPSNLLLDAAGRPHITDFGLARRGDNEITVTLDGQILGTPAYMSPEQAAGDQHHVDARSDVYSLGVVLYELLTGELPFRGNQRMLLHQVIHDEPRPPRSLNDRVPRDLETICLKAMSKTPARRYGSALEMADDLRRFLNNEAIRARRVGRTEKLARWVRRNLVVASLTAMVALLLVAVAAGEFLFVVTERRLNHDLADALDASERNHREAELRAASAAVDLDLKHCQDGELEYGVLRLARTLAELPPHATELCQCVEMNLLAWAQDIRPLGPTFLYDGAETRWELSPDGLTVLTGGADGTAHLWDTFTGEVGATLRGHRGGISSVAFSQNGRVAMTVGDDGTVRLWDASTGEARGVTAEHRKMIDKAVLSPDGKRLLTICHDYDPNAWGTVPPDSRSMMTLWVAATGKLVSVLAEHADHVFDAAISPDGRIVLTGGADKTARLWSASSGGLLATLQGHRETVVGVAFSPDGQRAATFDGTVRWWDLSRSVQVGAPSKYIDYRQNFHFIQRDFISVEHGSGPGLSRSYGFLFAQGMEQGFEFVGTPWNCRADEDCLVDPQGRCYDRHSGELRPIRSGRKFNDELVRFAVAGRFLELDNRATSDRGGVLVDLTTEKTIGGTNTKPSAFRFVPNQRSYLVLDWPSLHWISLPDSSLDPEIARLFAEVITCHELDSTGIARQVDEATWDKRRGQLAQLLKDRAAPPSIVRVASDLGFWLRRQIDRATTAEEKIKYLDLLIAVEPTWQNYRRRAFVHRDLNHRAEAAQDWLEAARRAGEGYWHRLENVPSPAGVYRVPSYWANNLAEELILPATCSVEEYQVGLSLAEALNRAFPKDRNYRVLHALALYRVGRYMDALSHLESLLKERERDIASLVGQFFMMGCLAVALANRESEDLDTLKAMAFLAMTHHRLSHRDRARSALDDLRRLGEIKRNAGPAGTFMWKTQNDYQHLLREAETLIEGKPRPGK